MSNAQTPRPTTHSRYLRKQIGLSCNGGLHQGASDTLKSRAGILKRAGQSITRSLISKRPVLAHDERRQTDQLLGEVCSMHCGTLFPATGWHRTF